MSNSRTETGDPNVPTSDTAKDLDDLMSRDFLKNRSRSGIDMLLFQMENDDWFLCKGEDGTLIHACRKAVKKLLPDLA